MYQRTSPRNYIVGSAWLLLGLAIGLHFPDVDQRLQMWIPSRLLLHRSILTHGMLASLLLFAAARRRDDKRLPLRLFVIGASLAVAVHLCFDFFPRAWRGFALIHIPIHGWTSALFSQAWLLLSIAVCMYVAFLLVRNVFEWALGVGNLIISFVVSAFEGSNATLSAFVLLALVTVVTTLTARLTRRAASR